MKITAIGFARKVYPPHKILDRKLRKTRRPMGHLQTWEVDKDTGEITFSWHNWSLTMNGNFVFSASLSREEVVRLFVSSMAHVPLNEVVQLLADTSKKPTAAPVAGSAGRAVAKAA